MFSTGYSEFYDQRVWNQGGKQRNGRCTRVRTNKHLLLSHWQHHSWTIFRILFFIALVAMTATSDGFQAVVQKDLEGESKSYCEERGHLTVFGPGPVLWVYSQGRGEHVRVLEPHLLCGYLHRKKKQKNERSCFGKTLGHQPYCGCLLKNVSHLVNMCLRLIKKKRSVLIWMLEVCVCPLLCTCSVLGVFPPKPSVKLWG